MKKNRLGFPRGERGRETRRDPPPFFSAPVREQWQHEAVMLLGTLCSHHPSSLFRDGQEAGESPL